MSIIFFNRNYQPVCTIEELKPGVSVSIKSFGESMEIERRFVILSNQTNRKHRNGVYWARDESGFRKLINLGSENSPVDFQLIRGAACEISGEFVDKRQNMCTIPVISSKRSSNNHFKGCRNFYGENNDPIKKEMKNKIKHRIERIMRRQILENYRNERQNIVDEQKFDYSLADFKTRMDQETKELLIETETRISQRKIKIEQYQAMKSVSSLATS